MIKRLIRGCRRRIRSIVKRVRAQEKQQEQKVEEPKTESKTEISIEELCHLLKIDVPKEYESEKTKPVSDTTLFDSLKAEGRVTLVAVGLYGLDKRAKSFKKSYHQMSTFDHSDSELLRLFVEYVYAFRPLKFSPSQYFAYELHKKSTEEANKYINTAFRGRISRCNSVEHRKYFRQKNLCNEKFSKYIHRKWIYAPDSDLCEFAEFVKEFPTCLVKPDSANKGKGVRILKISNEDNIEQLYNQCVEEKLILEQVLSNEKTIKEINPCTLNTLRINTFVDVNDKPNVVTAGIRFGRKGGVIDNHAAGGVWALIDVASGIIMTDGLDKSHVRHSVHPDTLKEIKGVKIPKWDEIIEVVKELSVVVPEVRNVGWDIALTEDGKIELIEGNNAPNLYITQEPDQVGKRHLYEKYVEEVEKLKE